MLQCGTECGSVGGWGHWWFKGSARKKRLVTGDNNDNNNNNNNNMIIIRDKTNVEPEMYDYTSYIWSYCNRNEKLKEKPGSCTGKTLDRLTTADSCTGNSTHSAESAAVWDWSEWWESMLVQGECREEKVCDKRQQKQRQYQ
jgi:hypothetical protein